MIKSYAPGRAVLLGDGVEGPALFIAIEQGILLSGSRRDNDEILVYARDIPATYEGSLRRLEPSAEKPWADPLLAVFSVFRRKGLPVGGANLTIQSDLPAGEGLGGPAALASAAVLFLHRAFAPDQPEPDAAALAHLVQEALQEFAPGPVALADTLSPFFGRAGHAARIEKGSEEIEYLPLPAGASFVIAPVDGDENRREDARVEAGAEALRRGDAAAFGALLADAGREGMVPIQMIDAGREPQFLKALNAALPGVSCLCTQAAAAARVDGY
ncbi:MAG: hypothetical protein PW734_01590 [Verrucomicrobium sp.]|nr:hypothetical protein [Verrucomicrobium sp.]